MKRTPPQDPCSTFETLSRSGDLSVAPISVCHTGTDPSLGPREEFDQALASGEQEAREIQEARDAAKSKHRAPNSDHDPISDLVNSTGAILSEDGKGRKGNVRYDHDLQSAREEIVSNVEEVQKFNEQLEALSKKRV